MPFIVVKSTKLKTGLGINSIAKLSKSSILIWFPSHIIPPKNSRSTHFRCFSTPALAAAAMSRGSTRSGSTSTRSRAPSRCFVCHSKKGEVKLTYTSCCNLPVCESCEHSHQDTGCATHFKEGHKGDWRECKECNWDLFKKARKYLPTTGLNITPRLEHFIPQVAGIESYIWLRHKRM